MKRYEIRCYYCSALIGYGSFTDAGHPADYIDSTRMDNEDKITPILCLQCEAKRRINNDS